MTATEALKTALKTSSAELRAEDIGPPVTRLFFEEKLQTGLTLSIEGEKARYLCTVLRCRPDDRIIVTDHTGTAYYARITVISARQAAMLVEGQIDQHNESPVEITLMQGLLKGEKMDLVIQKATELGVTDILPVITERCQLRQTRKLDRWQKIAEEASRQSGRNRIPQIHGPQPFGKALNSCAAQKGIIFWEKEGNPFKQVLDLFGKDRALTLCVGPEGGFSDAEVASARDQGFYTAYLGRRILRAETAAISVVSIVQFSLGDIGSQH